MSLKPQTIPPVPNQTVTVARAAFPKGTAALRLRDELGTIYQDDLFAALYPPQGQPAAAPWRLALVSVLQFLEGLPDRQAADAVRGGTVKRLGVRWWAGYDRLSFWLAGDQEWGGFCAWWRLGSMGRAEAST